MKNLLVCFLVTMMMGSAELAMSVVYPVTFTVDLAGANVVASPNGVHLAGNFQDLDYDLVVENAAYENWNPAGIEMLDQGNGVFAVTLDLVPGHYEFKFINGNNWGSEEVVPAIAAMGLVNGGNRYLEVHGATEYSVCFAGAVECGQNGVLFLVDMSTVDLNGNGIPGEFEDIGPEGVHLAGNFAQNGAGYAQWDPSALKCTRQNQNIFSILLQLPIGEYQYKFVNGNAWGLEEPSTANCFVSGNRVINFSGNLLSLPVVCFGGCSSCIPDTHVTFRLNMSNEVVSPNGVHIAGSFQNWNPGDPEWEMYPVGGGIFELVKDIPPGYYEFKYVNGNDWSGVDNDNENVPLLCNVNGNRPLTVEGVVETVQYCYNQCSFSCNDNPGDAQLTFQVNMNEYLQTNVLNEFVWVISSGLTANNGVDTLQMQDGDGDGIYTLTTMMQGSSAVYYRFALGTNTNNLSWIENEGLSSCGVYDIVQGYFRYFIRNGVNEEVPVVCLNRCFNCQGCMDNTACNYNPMAFIPDSCYTLQTWYADIDADGYGSDLVNEVACIPQPGYILTGGDCQDSDAAIHPSALEVCDQVDQNCNGEADEFLLNAYYADMDGDGFGDLNAPVFACSLPNGYVTNSDDCTDAMITFLDADGDGFGTIFFDACGAFTSDDCNDADALAYPGAPELCNAQDDNCNVTIDENLGINWYADNDGDGFGSNNLVVNQCAPIPGFLLTGGDCNDLSPNINPLISETCNNLDDDCNGQIDDGVLFIYYADSDADGFGNPNNFIAACSMPSSGFVTNGNDCDDNLWFYLDQDGDGFGIPQLAGCGVTNAEDCDDLDAANNPLMPEVCNEIDDNCNGEIDEFVQQIYFIDADGDGFGSSNTVQYACSAPAGFVSNMNDCTDNSATYYDVDMDGYGAGEMVPCGDVFNAGDCDPNNISINPMAIEFCNQVDDNCDGLIDEGLLTQYFADLDADGFGDPSVPVFECTQPMGFVLNGDDCDDFNITYADVDGDGYGVGNPIACGSALTNDDCDDNLILFADVDGDGHGAGNPVACSGVLLNDDCNDANAQIGPEVIEICDGFDQNCNNVIDEGLIFNDYYIDLDGDAYGSGNAVAFCANPGLGYSLDGTDCDDSNLNINPGAAEIPDNNVDENCDGQVVVGVMEHSVQAVQLYPNPSTGSVWVQWSYRDNVTYTLTNITGQVLMTGKQMGVQQMMLDDAILSNGLYHLRVQFSNGDMQSIPWLLQR